MRFSMEEVDRFRMACLLFFVLVTRFMGKRCKSKFAVDAASGLNGQMAPCIGTWNPRPFVGKHMAKFSQESTKITNTWRCTVLQWMHMHCSILVRTVLRQEIQSTFTLPACTAILC